jgi:hypothetical protein
MKRKKKVDEVRAEFNDRSRNFLCHVADSLHTIPGIAVPDMQVSLTTGDKHSLLRNHLHLDYLH